jgi:DNA-binding beta-propeller fold protein YncE
VCGTPQFSQYGTLAYDLVAGTVRWTGVYSGTGGGQGNLNRPTDMALTPDGQRLVVTGRATGPTGTEFGTVAYATADGASPWTAGYTGVTGANSLAEGLAVAPDGTRVYVTGPSGTLPQQASEFATVAYEVASGRATWTARFPSGDGPRGSPTSVAVTPTGDRVVAAGFFKPSTGGENAADYGLAAYAGP